MSGHLFDFCLWRTFCLEHILKLFTARSGTINKSTKAMLFLVIFSSIVFSIATTFEPASTGGACPNIYYRVAIYNYCN